VERGAAAEKEIVHLIRGRRGKLSISSTMRGKRKRLIPIPTRKKKKEKTQKGRSSILGEKGKFQSETSPHSFKGGLGGGGGGVGGVGGGGGGGTKSPYSNG